MSKAEEICRRNYHGHREGIDQWMLAAVNEALDWAAQQCETGDVSTDDDMRSGAYALACRSCATLIRDGKSVSA